MLSVNYVCFSDEQKTESELKREEEILNEMMEIVSERDSLVKVIEEDRLRCCHSHRPTSLHFKQSIDSNQHFLSSACFLFIFIYIVWCASLYHYLASESFI